MKYMIFISNGHKIEIISAMYFNEPQFSINNGGEGVLRLNPLPPPLSPAFLCHFCIKSPCRSNLRNHCFCGAFFLIKIIDVSHPIFVPISLQSHALKEIFEMPFKGYFLQNCAQITLRKKSYFFNQFL